MPSHCLLASYVFDEKSVVIVIVVSWYIMILFPLPAFFSLWAFRNWTPIYPVFLSLSYLLFAGLLGSVNLCSLSDFFFDLNFLYSSTIFDPIFSLLFWNSNYIHVRLHDIIPQGTDALFIYFSIFFPASVSFWVIYVDLVSSWLFLLLTIYFLILDFPSDSTLEFPFYSWNSSSSPIIKSCLLDWEF